MEQEKQHSLLSASKSKRWLTCTPSARLELMEPDEDTTVYAEEGTLAHAFAEVKLSHIFNKISDKEYEETLEILKNSKAGKLYYNGEFEEYVDDFVEYVTQKTKSLEKYHIYFELGVDYSNVAPQGFGTADVVLIAEDWVEIIDLKFGKGIPVSAKENSQLRLYGMGLLNMFPNVTKVYTTIHQPRLYACDTEELTKEKLLDWCFNYVKPRADLAIEGKGEFCPSEEACRFCKMRGKCKAQADNALALAQKEFEIAEQDGPPLPQKMSVKQISEILEIAPLLKNWLKDIEAYALGQLIAGVKIPGYKLVEGRSNRIMTDKEKIKEILLGVGLTEDMIMKSPEMLGISKLESLVGKKLFGQLCQEYLIKPQGKLTMAPESDRRPGVDALTIAQNDFQ